MTQPTLGDLKTWPIALVAFVLGIVALVLGSIPFVSFIAWLPALGAIGLGIYALIKGGARRWQSFVGVGLGGLAWVVAIAVSLSTVSIMASGARVGESTAPAAAVPVPTGTPTMTPTSTRRPSPTPTPTVLADLAPADPAAVVMPATGAVTKRGALANDTLAIDLLGTLEVKGRAPKTGYDRAGKFGSAWLDVDRNGCDTRNDVLARDLVDIVKSGPCKVTSGTLNDPFVPVVINFVRGNDTSMAVQVDHVVALMNAWETGAQQLSQAERVSFANDPLNLLAVDGKANGQKAAGDAATWLPANKPFRCEYVARQVSVKHAYGLWVTAAERNAIAGILAECPGQLALSSTFAGPPEPAAPPSPPAPDPAPVPAPAPEPAPPPPPPPSSVYYKNCDAARAAGAAPVHVGDPGYGTHLDRDKDGIGCE